MDKTLQKPLSFSEQWRFCMSYPKNDSLCQTCDVIGHDVMVEPDISNERARTVLYGREVLWSKLYYNRICSRFISAKFGYFLAKISKKPNNPRRRAEDGTLN